MFSFMSPDGIQQPGHLRFHSSDKKPHVTVITKYPKNAVQVAQQYDNKPADVEVRINAALAKLRNELLDLKNQDSELYKQLRAIDCQIQRLKIEVRAEEEKKAQFLDEEDEYDTDDDLFLHRSHQKSASVDRNHNLRHVVQNDVSSDNVTHERYDSGILADDGGMSEDAVGKRNELTENGSNKYLSQSSLKYDRPQKCVVSRSVTSQAQKRYTTFVLTAPKQDGSETQGKSSRERCNSQNSETMGRKQVPRESNTVSKTMASSTDRKIRRSSWTHSDRSIASKDETRTLNMDKLRRSNSCKMVFPEYEGLGRPVTIDGTPRSSSCDMMFPEYRGAVQRDLKQRGSVRRQSSGKTVSLVNISENGELMLHDLETGKNKPFKLRKQEMELEVCSAIDAMSKRKVKGYAVACYQEKSSSSIDLRSSLYSGPDSGPSFGNTKPAFSLSDLNSESRTSRHLKEPTGFAPVPGQRNTLPLSRTASVDGSRIHDELPGSEGLPSAYIKGGNNKHLRRSYSLMLQRRAPALTSYGQGIASYRPPSGENFQEHTLAYHNAARSFSRSVSVGSLV